MNDTHPAVEPTVTVAIPLHASARWVDNVVANVRRLPELVTEIVVSDATCVDDAADRIRAALADDPRVTVRAEPLGLGWTEHFQRLVEEADGDLFMWMPHDDVFEADWVPVLADALARHPDAWLAYGRLEPVGENGRTGGPHRPYHPRPGLISRARVAHIGARGMGVGVRGLFRRRAVLEAGIRFDDPPTAPGEPAADIAWVFAVGLRSALVHTDRTTTYKRYYPTSTSAGWRRPVFSDVRVTLAVAREHLPGGPRGIVLRAAMWLGIAQWVCRRPFGVVVNPLRDRWARRRPPLRLPD